MKQLIFLFLFLLSSLVNIQAYAQNSQVAGKVIFSSGINKIIDRAGKSKLVRRGDAIKSGDRLQTSTGRMQVRFTDKGFVSIKPRSELLVEDYRFNKREDGKENAVYTLIKGSIRAVTGLIGRTNKRAYQFKTPVATIGIRGTAFALNFCNKDCFNPDGSAIADGLYVNNGEGKVVLTSDGGSIALTKGQFAYVKNKQSAPTQILQVPAIVERARERLVNNENDKEVQNILDQGDQLVVLSNTNQRSGFAIGTFSRLGNDAGANVFGTEYNEILRPIQDGIMNVEGESIVFLEESPTNSNFNRMIAYRQSFDFLESDGTPRSLIETFTTSNNAQGQFGGNNQQGVIWGTWETGWQNTQRFLDVNGDPVPGNGDEYNANEDYLFHYILSNQLTPLDVNTGRYAGLNTRLTFGSTTNEALGGQVAYFNTGMSDGTEAIYGKQNVFLDIDFNDGTLHAFDLNGEFSDGAGSLLGGYTAQLDSAGGTQSIYGNSTVDLEGNCSAGLCGEALTTGDGEGAVDFVGASAQVAIGTYVLNFTDSTSTNHVVGASYLVSQSGTVTAPAVTGIDGIVVAASGFDAVNTDVIGGSSGVNGTGIVNIGKDAGGSVEAFEYNDNGTNYQFNARQLSDGTPSTTTALSLQGSDTDLNVQWGVWDSSNYLFNVNSAVNFDAGNLPLHYMYTDNITPDANLPTASSIVYNFAGGNISYAQGLGSVNRANGVIDNASLTIDFGAAQVTDFTFNATFTDPLVSGTIAISETGIAAPIAQRDFTVGAITCGVCAGSTPIGTVNYEFVGQNAEGVISSMYFGDNVTDAVTASTLLKQ